VCHVSWTARNTVQRREAGRRCPSWPCGVPNNRAGPRGSVGCRVLPKRSAQRPSLQASSVSSLFSFLPGLKTLASRSCSLQSHSRCSAHMPSPSLHLALQSLPCGPSTAVPNLAHSCCSQGPSLALRRTCTLLTQEDGVRIAVAVRTTMRRRGDDDAMGTPCGDDVTTAR